MGRVLEAVDEVKAGNVFGIGGIEVLLLLDIIFPSVYMVEFVLIGSGSRT
jgi:translation elongation factor EF-G